MAVLSKADGRFIMPISKDLHPPLHRRDKTAIGFDKTAIRQDLFAPGSSLLSWEADKTFMRLRFPFVSSRNLKFVHGSAVDKFFTREMVKIAIRAPNPEIWPRMHYFVFETSI